MALLPTTRERRSAIQDLEELRNERELFKAAVDLTRLLTPAAPTRPTKKSKRNTKVVSEVPRDEEPSREALEAMVACVEIIADRSSDWLHQYTKENGWS